MLYQLSFLFEPIKQPCCLITIQMAQVDHLAAPDFSMMPHMAQHHLFVLQTAEDGLPCICNLLAFGLLHLCRQGIAAVARVAVWLHQPRHDQPLQCASRMR